MEEAVPFPVIMWCCCHPYDSVLSAFPHLKKVQRFFNHPCETLLEDYPLDKFEIPER